MNNTEDDKPGSPERVVSVRFGELNLCGCENHPHRLDLSCCKIRQTDGTALTTKQVWEVLNEIATAKHANAAGQRQPPRPVRLIGGQP